MGAQGWARDVAATSRVPKEESELVVGGGAVSTPCDGGGAAQGKDDGGAAQGKDDGGAAQGKDDGGAAQVAAAVMDSWSWAERKTGKKKKRKKKKKEKRKGEEKDLVTCYKFEFSLGRSSLSEPDSLFLLFLFYVDRLQIGASISFNL
ncbi:hypothetical protein M0R45_020351 [Rubus argutus]|uniref:Uncharacterized protein n=1 Tax=Rubus argutus TaxID=59490 RepID=A0AAW1X9R8_RUBAR